MKPEPVILEERFAKLGKLKKISEMTGEEISEVLASLGSKSPHILYGHNIIYVVGNLQFKGSTYYFTGPDISAFLVISDHEIQIFSPSVPGNHKWYVEFARICLEFGLDLRIIHVDEQWAKKSGIAEDDMWQITARSQSEAVYDIELLNELAGKDFAKLRLVRNKLVDSGMIQFEDIETAGPILDLLRTWNSVQGGKYSKDKFEQEAFILKTIMEFKKRYPDVPAYLRYGRLGEKVVSYCLFSILPQDPDYAVIHTLKGINKPEAGGIHGASDATYLHVFKYLREKGVRYINDGELGSEQGTREHKLRFMPVRFNQSYDLLYGGRNRQHGKNLEDFAPFRGRETVLTMFARNALYLGLKELVKLAPGKKPVALLPAYNCGDEIGPFQKLGFETHFYAIKSDLSADMDDLSEKMEAVRPDVVLVTHYFGFPQTEIEKIKAECKKNEAFLIEDCAHAFQSEFSGRELGSFGDMAIFSLRKFFNIPDGGALRINDPNISCPQTREADGEAAEKSRKYFSMVWNKEVLPGTTPEEIFKKLDYTIDPLTGERFVAEGGYELGMPSSTETILRGLDISEELKRRKNAFTELETNFETITHKPDKLLAFPELTAANPSYFPFLVHDSQKFLSFLRERNIHTGNPFWTNFSRTIRWEAFLDTAKLKNSVYIINLAKDIPEGEQIIFFNALNDYNREFPEI